MPSDLPDGSGGGIRMMRVQPALPRVESSRFAVPRFHESTMSESGQKIRKV